MATKTGHGADVTIAGITLNEITDISWSGISRNAIETTNMATGATTSAGGGGRSYIPASPTDAGELTVEANLDSTAAGDGWITAIDAAAGDVVLSFPGSGTWTTTGFVTGLSYSVPLEDKMTASVTVKLTKDIVVA